MWQVTYENDSGPNDDEGFAEWWVISDGDHSFNADIEEEALWLCHLLNEIESNKNVQSIISAGVHPYPE